MLVMIDKLGAIRCNTLATTARLRMAREVVEGVKVSDGIEVQKMETPVDGILLDPVDWASIELSKEATTNAYLWAKPQIAATPML